MLLKPPTHQPSRFGRSTSDRGRTDRYMTDASLDTDRRMARIDALERHIVTRVLGRLAPGATVADVPCGNGRMSRIVHGQACRLIALDLNPAMLASMTVRGDAGLLRRRACADVLRLPLADRSVDLLINMRLLHHIAERPLRLAMLGELARVTRQWLITSFWTTHSWRYLRRRALGKPIRGFPISPRELHALCADSDLEIESLIPARRLYEEQVVAVCKRRGA